MNEPKILDLGLQTYSSVLTLQEKLFNQNWTSKQQSLPTQNHLLICSHFPVYTLGKNASAANLLPKAMECGAEVVKTNRGGDVTFHGPGQLVFYPIIDLEYYQLGLAAYVQFLEQTVLETIDLYGIKGFRMSDAPGIWVNSKKGGVKKICAIGIKASRFITMHGLALNVNTDLNYFDYIIPCGIADKGVTRVADETNVEVSLHQVMQDLTTGFNRLLLN